jgi:hypothetical protein
MLSIKDVRNIYETLLATPGMNEEVKINLKVSRKTVLFLSKAIELGLQAKGETEGASLLMAADEASIEKLKVISGEILGAASLVETNERITELIKNGK